MGKAEQMNYKEALEEQIEKLQQVQEMVLATGPLELSVSIAKAILEIVNYLDKETCV